MAKKREGAPSLLELADQARDLARAQLRADREAFDRRAAELSEQIGRLSDEKRALERKVHDAHNHILHLDHQLLQVRAAVAMQWSLPGLAPVHIIGHAEKSIMRPDGRDMVMVPEPRT